MEPSNNHPEFIDNPTFIDMDTSVSETEQLRAMLSNLTRVHLLSANKFDNFDVLIHEYILSGIEVFGLETGIVSEITDGNLYRVCDVISPLDILVKDMEFPLEETYCKEVFASQKVLGFPEVGKLDYMKCHPVYKNLQLEAYLSAPIFVGDKLFGTFNFTSTTPRKRGFSRHEHDLILLMANSIGAFILLRQKEDKLLDLNTKMKRFVGYLAHDLRSPLGAIISFSKLGSRPNTSPDRLQNILSRINNLGEQALELVSTILEGAALSAGKIALEKSNISVQALFQPSLDSTLPFALDYAVDISLDGSIDKIVTCDTNRIQQCLNNLLINAIKYSPAHTTVTINANTNGKNCLISIINKVSTEKKILSEDYHTVYNSVGFGLDIVSQVMSAHNTEFSQFHKNNAFYVEFSLPIAQ